MQEGRIPIGIGGVKKKNRKGACGLLYSGSVELASLKHQWAEEVG